MSMNKKELDELMGGFDEMDDVEDEQETVGFESDYIVGYGGFDVRIQMAKLVLQRNNKNKITGKVQWIEIDFETKDGKKMREKYMIKGKDGKPFFMRKGKKSAHFGVSKIKSLITVAGLYDGESNKMKALFSNTEEAEVEYNEYGKDKKEDFVVFPDLIGAKVKILVGSKKENATTATDDDDAYIQFCIAQTEAFKKANPKRKFAAKFKKDDEYVNVFKWYTVTEVKHFATLGGLLQSEMVSGEGSLAEKYLGMQEEGHIFDMRTLVVEDMSEGERNKWNLNEYGKVVEADSDEGEETYEEPEEESDGDDEWD